MEIDSEGKLNNNSKKLQYYTKGTFVICRNHFKIKSNSVVQELNNLDLLNLQIKDIFYFLTVGFKKDELGYITRPYKNFEKIYIIEDIGDNKFLKFEVEWKEVFIN